MIVLFNLISFFVLSPHSYDIYSADLEFYDVRFCLSHWYSEFCWKSGVLAEEATRIASDHSDVFTAKILDVEQCKELKMGSYLAVAAASSNPPHFIHLCYKPPGGTVKAKLALVGKGLTFDW